MNFHSRENLNQNPFTATEIDIFGNTLSQNFVYEDIKRKLNSGIACNDSVQNISSYSVLSTKVKIKIYKHVILPAVCMGVKHGLAY